MSASPPPYTFTYTDSTSTTSTNHLSTHLSVMEKFHHWLDCFDQPKIRKPYLPSQVKRYDAVYKNPIPFKPFLGNKFKVGRNKT